MKKYIFIIPALLFLLTGCKQQELLKGLDQGQANEVVALLQHNNIRATKSMVNKEGYIINVDPTDFAAAVDLMNIYQLPARPRVEIAQMFPSDSLVSSPVAERARLYSAIEQRLEQSLLNLQGVVSTRVHVSYELNASEARNKSLPVHISSLLKYDESIKDATLLINDAKRFIKNSFNNVEYDNISVVVSRIPDIQRISADAPIDKGVPLTVWISIIAGGILFMISITFIVMNSRYQHRIPGRLKKYIPVHKLNESGHSRETTETGDAPTKN
ncbi:EscJ/YscJ/HrcJ family type III secretion inner membrane ring protein [Serratia silvae]|uniref:Lipoprotein n=1 Tax=Serratia silvae TaxID=2824122 RepID=A0ABT0K9R8_9GAMM|nr:EscJ/YscJ/HrcJ family type III secretion inner membrane ring protein [Serratia silvae]MCL1028778.1 EscJ/YscJ/HrcJ family type III secretion inner membrane ring protein [Serratia silvae]